MLELATGVCATPREAQAALQELRAAADEAARTSGLRIAAAGTHPFSLPQVQDIAPDPRYREFVEYAGITARRQARLRPARPRLHARARGVPARARGRPALAARSSSRCRRTRPTSPARRRALPPRGPRCWRCCRGPRHRRSSARTRSGRRSSSASSGSGSPTATRASGGTSGRTRASARWRCAHPISRRPSSRRLPSRPCCRRSA